VENMAAANTTLAVLQRNNISQAEYWSRRILEMIKLEKSNFVYKKDKFELFIFGIFYFCYFLPKMLNILAYIFFGLYLYFLLLF